MLTAQKSLLGAQLSKVSDDFYRMQAVVNLTMHWEEEIMLNRLNKDEL